LLSASFFSKALPALSKMKLENKKTILDEGCALSSRFCRLPPPPHLPPVAQESAAYIFLRGNFGNAVAGGHTLSMPLHRAIFAFGFFRFKIVHIRMHDALVKTHFRCTHISPRPILQTS
jgi:hypothetical protein